VERARDRFVTSWRRPEWSDPHPPGVVMFASQRCDNTPEPSVLRSRTSTPRRGRPASRLGAVPAQVRMLSLMFGRGQRVTLRSSNAGVGGSQREMDAMTMLLIAIAVLLTLDVVAAQLR